MAQTPFAKRAFGGLIQSLAVVSLMTGAGHLGFNRPSQESLLLLKGRYLL
jgi:hypothetical protein